MENFCIQRPKSSHCKWFGEYHYRLVYIDSDTCFYKKQEEKEEGGGGNMLYLLMPYFLETYFFLT